MKTTSITAGGFYFGGHKVSESFFTALSLIAWGFGGFCRCHQPHEDVQWHSIKNPQNFWLLLVTKVTRRRHQQLSLDYTGG